MPGPLFASPTPCAATLFRSITVFSLPKQVLTQLVYAFALRSMLYNARTEQYLRLTTQCLNCTNPLNHLSLPRPFKAMLFPNDSGLSLITTPRCHYREVLCHSSACRIRSFTKPISALAFRFITRPLRCPGVLCPAFAQPFFVLLCLYSANFSLLYPAFATLIHFGTPHSFT